MLWPNQELALWALMTMELKIISPHSFFFLTIHISKMNIYFTKEIKTLHFMLSQKEELWLKYLNMKAPLHIFQRMARNKVICQINVFHNNPSGGSQMTSAHTGRILLLLYNSNPGGRVMADTMPACSPQWPHQGYELGTANIWAL